MNEASAIRDIALVVATTPVIVFTNPKKADELFAHIGPVSLEVQIQIVLRSGQIARIAADGNARHPRQDKFIELQH